MSARAEDIWRKFVDQMTDEERSEVDEWLDKTIRQRTGMYDREKFLKLMSDEHKDTN